LLERIKGLVKDESGQITTTEVVILVAVIALLVGVFSDELKAVFTGKGGTVEKLNNFVSSKFDAVITSNDTSN